MKRHELKEIYKIISFIKYSKRGIIKGYIE